MADKDFVVKNGLIVNSKLIYASNGLVGIANSSPDAQLTVTGTANISANVVIGGTLKVGTATINSTVFTGTANNASYIGGISSSNYVTTSGNYTFTGQHTYSNSVTIDVGTAILATDSSGAPASPGQNGQVLASNGTALYWSTPGLDPTASVYNIIYRDVQLAGDGSNTQFTLSLGTTTNNAFVAINGIQQIPTVAYTINKRIITFNTAPSNTDVIDVRIPTFSGTNGVLAGYSVFRYIATAGQTTFTGNDANSTPLAYVPGEIAVFKDGIKLADNSYTATNNTSVVLNIAATAGQVIEIISYAGITFQNSTAVDRISFNANTTTLSSYSVTSTAATITELESFSTAGIRSVNYVIQVTDNTNSNYQMQNINLLHNGTTVFMSEYGTIYSNGSSISTFDATINTGVLTFTATPVSANTTYRVFKTAMVL